MSLLIRDKSSTFSGDFQPELTGLSGFDVILCSAHLHIHGSDSVWIHVI